MEESPLHTKINILIKFIQTHTIQILLWVLFVAIIVILSFSLHWNKPPSPAQSRNTLPVLPSTQSLALITEPDAGTTPVLSLIHKASRSIDLVMYQMTDKEIADAIIQAHARGVQTRIMLNEGYYGKPEKNINQVAYDYLQKAGVPIHWTPASFALTHQKTLIVDNAQALIMTWNFVPTYYPTGRDFGIIDTDQTDVTAIENTFSSDWNDTQSVSLLGDVIWYGAQVQMPTCCSLYNQPKKLSISTMRK